MPRRFTARFTAVKKVFLEHKYKLILTYSLFSLEMLGMLLRPFFLGEAVNDLLAGKYHGLILLSITHFSWLVIGTIRHMYDTRTYTAIYISLVTRVLSRKIDKSEVSRLSAHSTLAREFVDFLEYDLNYVVEALFNIVGSLILLFIYEQEVVWICLGILLPVMGISYVYGKKMGHLNRSKNDELEQQVDIIGTNDQGAIRQHYQNLRKWQIRISDQEAWSFGVMELMVLVVIASSLLVTTRGEGHPVLAGDIIGIYNYILKFVTGLDTIPYTVQKISSLNDITRRMELEVLE
jgi:ABC-type multidrug transport system fused ATPase/permease subunit